VLLVQGGVHPRGVTSVEVQGIGIDKAARIVYRALTTYLGQNSDFAAARVAYAQAAEDLYGQDEVYSVEEAWAAVAVGEGDGNVGPVKGGGGCSSSSSRGFAWLLILAAAWLLRRRYRR
jgi:vibriolysin